MQLYLKIRSKIKSSEKWTKSSKREKSPFLFLPERPKWILQYYHYTIYSKDNIDNRESENVGKSYSNPKMSIFRGQKEKTRHFTDPIDAYRS
jgi:hypothetical protein